MTAPTATRTRASRKPAAEETTDSPLPAELVPTPAPTAPVVHQEFAMLPLSAIKPSPANPRRSLGDLEGLAASMRAVGILEPLIVERQPSWEVQTYELVAGHRRLAAAKLAGLAEAPCIIRSTTATPAQRMETALVENLQREDLAALDEADGYKALVDLGLSQRAIAERVGCSQSHVSKRLALLELPSHVQARITKGTLPLEAAAALVKLKDHPDLLKKAAGEDPSAIVAAVERAEGMIAWEAKRAELVEVARGKKWPVVAEPRAYWEKRSFATLANWNGAPDLELDVRKHEAEPCHAVMIPKEPPGPYNLRPPSATSVCTDPGRHKPKGASALKAKVHKVAKRTPDAFQVKEARARLDRKAAADARTPVLTEALATLDGHRLPATVTMCLRRALEVAGWDAGKLAVELLGLAADANPFETLNAYAADGNKQLQRAALAVTLAAVETKLRAQYRTFQGEDVAEHYAYLATLGYQPTQWEQEQLDEAAKAKAERGD